MHRTYLILAAGFTLLLGSAQDGSACSIPVFRYALEHWSPDSYVAHVFSRGPLSPGEQARLALLTTDGADEPGQINLRIVVADLDAGLDPDAGRLWSRHASDELPHLLIERPTTGTQPSEVVWSGPLTAALVDHLLDSPLRTRIAQQLIEGESVVWVLLESGHAEQDNEAWKVLTSELSRLSETLELPPIDPADAAELTVLPESLKLSFASHRLSRESADEEALIELLLASEPDLRDPELSSQPMAFPIFGRGRSLYALVGQGINAGTIEEACRFLTAGCQCTVKQENPGTDLLFAIDWSLFVEPTVPLKTTLPPLVGVQNFAGDEAESLTGVTASAEHPSPTTNTVGAADIPPSPDAVSAPVARQAGESVPFWYDATLLICMAIAILVAVGTLYIGRSRS